MIIRPIKTGNQYPLSLCRYCEFISHENGYDVYFCPDGSHKIHWKLGFRAFWVHDGEEWLQTEEQRAIAEVIRGIPSYVYGAHKALLQGALKYIKDKE